MSILVFNVVLTFILYIYLALYNKRHSRNERLIYFFKLNHIYPPPRSTYWPRRPPFVPPPVSVSKRRGAGCRHRRRIPIRRGATMARAPVPPTNPPSTTLGVRRCQKKKNPAKTPEPRR